MCCEESADKGNNIFNNNKKNMEDMKKGRITPRWIDSLKENEIFVLAAIWLACMAVVLPA